MSKEDVVNAHLYSISNKPQLLNAKKCGCFYCLKIFSPLEIEEWLEDEEGTALCPYCRIDSVIGESSGYPITEEFLSEMHKYWF